MKKIMTLLLALVLCLCMFACGNQETADKPGTTGTTGTTSTTGTTGTTSTTGTTGTTAAEVETFDLYQAWQNALTGASMTFHQDGMVTLEDGMTFPFVYDEEHAVVKLDLEAYGMSAELSVVEENGVYLLTVNTLYFVTSEHYDAYHERALNEAYEEVTGGGALVSLGDSFAITDGVNIAITSVEILNPTNVVVNLYLTCENTTDVDTEIPDEFACVYLAGSAISGFGTESTKEVYAEDLMIPANSTKEIMVSVSLGRNLEEVEATPGSNIVYIMIGIPCGEADENGQYRYAYMDIAPFYTGEA